MKMLRKIICLLVIAQITIGAVIEPPVDFSQHQIIRILPNKLIQLDVLEKIKNDFEVTLPFALDLILYYCNLNSEQTLILFSIIGRLLEPSND